MNSRSRNPLAEPDSLLHRLTSPNPTLENDFNNYEEILIAGSEEGTGQCAGTSSIAMGVSLGSQCENVEDEMIPVVSPMHPEATETLIVPTTSIQDTPSS